MTRPIILITAAILIVSASMVPSAREHGVRLPNCWRLLQAQKQMTDLIRVSRPAVSVKISVSG